MLFKFVGEIATFEIMDQTIYGPGAEIFNFFFTLIMIFGLVAFSVQVLVRIISRS